MTDDHAGKKSGPTNGNGQEDTSEPRNSTAASANGSATSSVKPQGTCRISIDGQQINAQAGETILQAANKAGIEIPAMCWDPRIKPTGECELCSVVIADQANPVKACLEMVAEGQKIQTQTPELHELRKDQLNRYLSDHNAYCQPPCTAACPAGIDIAGYIDHITRQEYVEATALIKVMLPLPGVLGRVCPRPCEDPCRRIQIDGKPVAICALKRFAADKAAETSRPTQPDPKPSTEKRVAVVGAGPAGLSAAYYLALEGHKVTLLESAKKAGGMLRFGIPTYRLPDDVLDKEIDDILSLGIDLKTNQTMGKDYQIDTLLNDEGYDAVFLSIGAMLAKPPNIPDQDAEGVMPAIDFLARVNWGERVELGDRVIVIGGGFTAADAVRTARRVGASDVTMMYRRTRKEMSAAAHEIHECDVEGVKLELLTAPVAVKVENGRMVGLVSQRMELGEPDDSGRRRPVPIEGSEYFTPADTILLAIGQDVDVASLNEGDLGLNRWNTIEIDEATMMTNLKGVFAGGDCVTGAATVVEGVGAGRQAAYAINAYLHGADERGIAAAIFQHKPKFFDIGAKAKSNAPLTEMPVLDGDGRLATFEQSKDGDTLNEEAFAEVEVGFSEEEALREAGRCLLCRCQAAGVCVLQTLSIEYDAGTKTYLGKDAWK